MGDGLDETLDEDVSAAVVVPGPPVTTQSFGFPASWGVKSPVETAVGDVNGDGRTDVVEFGSSKTLIRLSSGSQFAAAIETPVNFGAGGGWTPEKHVRTLADVNGDGRADIVAFGDAGVWTALSTGTSFATAKLVVADFGVNQGYQVAEHIRVAADVNADGRADIVTFGFHGVWVARSNGATFASPALWLADMGTNKGWTKATHPRYLADVDADGRADVVGFGENGVYVARSMGSAFTAATLWSASFTPTAGGWHSHKHPRMMADVNGDNRQDVVGFGGDGVWVARSTGTGFSSPEYWLIGLGYNQGWRVDEHPRYVADVNGDKRADVVGFGRDGVFVGLAANGGFFARPWLLRHFVKGYGGWMPQNMRTLTDVNGDGLNDILGFGDGAYYASLSSAAAAPDPGPSWLPPVDGPALFLPSNARQFEFRRDNRAPRPDEYGSLFNGPNGTEGANSCLVFEERTVGINLGWDSSCSNEVRIHRDPEFSLQPLRYGERVAIHIEGGGYLEYGVRLWGINLEWSSTPVYEWRLVNLDSSKNGEPLSNINVVGLYNTYKEDFLVYHAEGPGVNLGWYKSTLEPPPPAPVEPFEEEEIVWLGRFLPTTGYPWWTGSGSLEGDLMDVRVPTQLGVSGMFFLKYKPGITSNACADARQFDVANIGVWVPSGGTMKESQKQVLFGSSMPFAPVPLHVCTLDNIATVPTNIKVEVTVLHD